MKNGEELLAEYVETNSEVAFQELVARYVDLVYSAAIRLVNGDTHRAEDVSQTVFADLARMARTLSKNIMLGGWLHRHTCFVASKTMRGERRRQDRERQAMEMNAPEDHSAENLAMVAPVLDEAIDELSAEDRAAIVLRFFEQKDFRDVGEKIGSNEEAARKRVNRALEKLHGLLKHRGVAFSATALATTLATEAVTAAPAGLAMTISGAAWASAATAGGGTTLAVFKIMTMTKLKVGIISAVVAAGIAIPLILQHQTQNKLRDENEALRQAAEQSKRLAAENERLKSAAQTSAPEVTDDKSARELVKLRGEVGKLRQENANVTSAAQAKPTGESMLSEMSTNAAMKKMIRDQQKMGMAMMYAKFGKDLKLSKEDGEKLNNLLADNVMDNVDHIVAVLRDGNSPAEQEEIFAQQDATLLEKVGGLIGQDNVAKYQEYTRDMASHLTSEQFKAELTGDKAAKEAKAKQLYEVMQAETQSALASAGLDPNFQTIPMLNFRNIASETEAEKNLKLLDGIYGNVAAKSTAFLSPEEQKKFQEFQANAVNGNRMALVMNRKMMSPSAK